MKEKEFSINKSDSYKKEEELTIFDVIPQSPADISGLKKNDILLKLDNKHITNITEIHEILNSIGNKSVGIEVSRGKEKLKLKVNLY